MAGKKRNILQKKIVIITQILLYKVIVKQHWRSKSFQNESSRIAATEINFLGMETVHQRRLVSNHDIREELETNSVMEKIQENIHKWRDHSNGMVFNCR